VAADACHTCYSCPHRPAAPAAPLLFTSFLLVLLLAYIVFISICLAVFRTRPVRVAPLPLPAALVLTRAAFPSFSFCLLPLLLSLYPSCLSHSGTYSAYSGSSSYLHLPTCLKQIRLVGLDSRLVSVGWSVQALTVAIAFLALSAAAQAGVPSAGHLLIAAAQPIRSPVPFFAPGAPPQRQRLLLHAFSLNGTFSVRQRRKPAHAANTAGRLPAVASTCSCPAPASPGSSRFRAWLATSGMPHGCAFANASPGAASGAVWTTPLSVLLRDLRKAAGGGKRGGQVGSWTRHPYTTPAMPATLLHRHRGGVACLLYLLAAPFDALTFRDWLGVHFASLTAGSSGAAGGRRGTLCSRTITVV